MAYYDICPVCGAHLDPGEPCDCQDRIEEEPKRPMIPMEIERHTGQLRMILRREHEEITVN